MSASIQAVPVPVPVAGDDFRQDSRQGLQRVPAGEMARNNIGPGISAALPAPGISAAEILQGRILIVDDQLANVRLLQQRTRRLYERVVAEQRVSERLLLNVPPHGVPRHGWKNPGDRCHPSATV